MPSITHVRVRYKDTDTMAVVYYGNYLTYFEVGRVEHMRQHGLTIDQVDRHLRLPVTEAFVRYVRPARLDDLLEVTTRVSERRRASFRFSYEIRNGAAELVATGWTTHGCVDPTSDKVIAVPEWLKDIMPDADLDPAPSRAHR
jgi:acyl-CoA thioester hydrolase